ncbi:hypothetical protein HAX54_038848, partial [Datura stramonium]|nr:hypothetical protein [Datura stramonium]
VGSLTSHQRLTGASAKHRCIAGARVLNLGPTGAGTDDSSVLTRIPLEHLPLWTVSSYVSADVSPAPSIGAP